MKEYKNIELKTNKIPLEGLGQWIITISGDDWAKILVRAENNLVANLQVPGFRKGKVPAHIAKKHIKDDEVLRNAGNSAIKIAYQYGLDQKDLDVKVTNKPGVEITDLSKSLCKLIFNFDLPLEVDLKAYTNFDIKKTEVEIEQAEIDQQVKLLKDRFAVYSPKEKGNLVTGDIAVFDFTGTIKGEEFPGGKAEDAQLEIGSNQFIAGFEEQMIGMKQGESKVIKVTFPQEYHIENLAGQEAEFAVTLKEIKIKLLTDNNEELVQDVNIPNVSTYQELVEYIREQLKEQKMRSVKDEFINNLFTEILKSANIIVPNSLIDKETDRLLNEFKMQLKQQNVTFEDYQKMTNLTEEEVRKEAQKDALWQLQTYILTEEIAKAENITATDGEIEDYINQISMQFNIPIEEIKKNMKDLNFIVSNIRRNKTLDWLWENNGSSTKTVEKKAAATAPKSKTTADEVKPKVSKAKAAPAKSKKN
ncbi:trigger factor [Spiroplasma platyhelix]|uniref:Trigger factor n=1 Tax=Spiroplasma platyhelix PALS-1 TaxID=1276218 RepID=A0A846TR08_9MOLU|nr:trigger factor [Spiroplasma platyhelix]MBE4704408.1 Trigger factor [Spiroplasma platyhelix PALS-1]NKE38780.1 trigger factor [Spiroplasma platyhelix PALS-1]UJB28991.1 trigger factor [Spiroplasma platyhelix PALS-1]